MRFIVTIHPTLITQIHEDKILDFLLDYFWIPPNSKFLGYYIEKVESVTRVGHTEFAVQIGDPVWQYDIWNSNSREHDLLELEIQCFGIPFDVDWGSENGVDDGNPETIKDQIYEALLISLEPEYDTDINVEIDNEMKGTICDWQEKYVCY